MPRGRRKRTAIDDVRAWSLALPEAYEDFPWGEPVVKVAGKIFVFLGATGADDQFLILKLPDSHPHALTVPGATPTGYGLGRSGWVSLPHGAPVPAEVLRDWVLESYCAVAPKRLVRAVAEAAESAR